VNEEAIAHAGLARDDDDDDNNNTDNKLKS
jgi:hypothetical protein